MLKIVHTSDWHLGHELSSFNRAEEQLCFLNQLADIVAAEQPDALVVSGDVFNTSTPSNSTMTMLADRLDAIRHASPATTIIVSAGNHDSGSRLETSRAPWLHLGVHMIGRVARHDDDEATVDLNRHVITLRDAATGQPKGVVVALPYIFDRGYPALDERPGNSTDMRHRFMARLNNLALEAATTLSGEQLPIVVMAHMAVKSCHHPGHDSVELSAPAEPEEPEGRKRTIIGGIEATDLDDFGIDFDYLALGHIHCPQTFATTAGNGRARYCGSPLAVSFDENYDHSVTVVEINCHGDLPSLRTIAITTPWPLVTLTDADGTSPLQFDRALEAIASYPTQAYLRARVRIDDLPPAAAAELAAKASDGSPARFCKFQWVRDITGADATGTTANAIDLDGFKALTPVEVANLYYSTRFEGATGMPPELLELFNEVCLEVENRVVAPES